MAPRSVHTSIILYVYLVIYRTVFKRAVAAIDIQLSNLDVNQCDGDESKYVFFNAFKGTHKCPRTTKVS